MSLISPSPCHGCSPCRGWQLTWEVGWPRWRGGHRRGGCHQYACSFDLELAGRPDPSAVVWGSPHPHHFAAARKEAVLCEAFPCAKVLVQHPPYPASLPLHVPSVNGVCYTATLSWLARPRAGTAFAEKAALASWMRAAPSGMPMLVSFYRKTGTRKASIPRCCHLRRGTRKCANQGACRLTPSKTRTGHRACRRLEAVEIGS